MLINRAGEVKISDFGIVRRLDEEEEEEEEGEEEGGREGGPRAPPTLIRLGENAQTFVGEKGGREGGREGRKEGGREGGRGLK